MADLEQLADRLIIDGYGPGAAMMRKSLAERLPVVLDELGLDVIDVTTGQPATRRDLLGTPASFHRDDPEEGECAT